MIVKVFEQPNIEVQLQVPDPNLVEVSFMRGESYAKGDPIYATVRNATGSTLTRGTVVYTSGANGTHVQVTKALATADQTSARTMGFIVDDIPNGQDGLCCIAGYLYGINTAGYTVGQIIYLSPTTAGTWTTTKPVAPDHMVYLGVITRINANNGSIYVHPQNGYELDELHNVKITNPQDGQTLKYQASTGLWINSF